MQLKNEIFFPKKNPLSWLNNYEKACYTFNCSLKVNNRKRKIYKKAGKEIEKKR